MKRVLMLCAVVGLAAPAAAVAQGRSDQSAGRFEDNKPGRGHEIGRGRGHEKHDDDRQRDARDENRDRLPGWIDRDGDGRDDRVEAARRRDRDDRRDDRDDRRADRRDDRDDRRDDRDDRWDNRRDGARVDQSCRVYGRDGRCEYNADSRAYPGGYSTRRSMPQMASVSSLERRRDTQDQRRWIGNANVIGRYTDRDRDGTPERIIWQDRSGRTVQVWTDTNRDGWADTVAQYENGRLVRVLR